MYVDKIAYQIYYNEDITYLDIPEGIQVITEEAGMGGTYGSNKELALPKSLKKICANAFNGCTVITNVIFRNGSQLETLGTSAFEGCTNLTNIELGETVTEIGARAFYGDAALHIPAIPSKVTYIMNDIFNGCTFNNTNNSYTIPDGVTTICDNAFAGCKGIKTLHIGKNAVRISETAFKDWAHCLQNITVDEKNTRFAISNSYNCLYDGNEVMLYTNNFIMPEGKTEIADYEFANSAITSFTIPASVLKIGKHAFDNCDKLVTVTCNGSQLEKVDEYAFAGCSALKTIKLDGRNANYHSELAIGKYAFSNCTSLNDCDLSYMNIAEISEGLFSGCTNLYEVTLPSTATKINTNAFRNTGVYDILNATGITEIGSHAFENCDMGTDCNLSSTFPALTTIGSFAFANCGIEGLTIPNTVTSLGNYAFSGCAALRFILNYPSSLKTIPEGLFMGCTDLTSYSTPAAVTSIGDYAFMNDKSLTYLSLNNTTTIGRYAFANCHSLDDPNLDNTKTIKDNAFNGCNALIYLTIPESVEEIGYKAFANCTNLQEINADCEPITLSTTTFKNVDQPNVYLYVYNGDAFELTPVWQDFYVIGSCDYAKKITNDATAIDSVAADELPEGTIYTLQGVKVKTPTAGRIYIINGKKVLVK